MKKVIIIRYGHRPQRDIRLSTHVALVSRALGADGIIFTDITDEKIKKSIEKVNSIWGGNFFIKMGINWKKLIKKIKSENNLLVHLTMYGIKLDDLIIKKINKFENDVYVFVGGKKVPYDIYKLADYNIAITHQPHSECGAIAIFLDRIFLGKTLYKEFPNAKLKIIPMERGKKVEIINK